MHERTGACISKPSVGLLFNDIAFLQSELYLPFVLFPHFLILPARNKVDSDVSQRPCWCLSRLPFSFVALFFAPSMNQLARIPTLIKSVSNQELRGKARTFNK